MPVASASETPEHPFAMVAFVHPPNMVAEALELRAAGEPIAGIARRIGIARSTVRQWLAGGTAALDERIARAVPAERCYARCDPPSTDLDELGYAYLLGQYLGDGCISSTGTTFRLRITCCDAYPGIMAEVRSAILAVRPEAHPGRIQRIGCTEIYDSWRHWPCLLPHGEGGVKHLRSIVLAPWQRRIALDIGPGAFVRGLIHSDGWRGINRVRGANGRRYEYPRYMFSNRSADIRALFVEACDRLDIATRPMNAWTIATSKRASVARLDEIVGPKR